MIMKKFYFILLLLFSGFGWASNEVYLTCDATSSQITKMHSGPFDKETSKVNLIITVSFYPDNRLLAIQAKSNNPNVTGFSMLNSPEYSPIAINSQEEWILKNTDKHEGFAITHQVRIDRYTGILEYFGKLENPKGTRTDTINGNCNKMDAKKKF